MLIDPYRSTDEFFVDTFMLIHVEDGQIYERTGFPAVSIIGGGAVSSVEAMFGTESFRNPGTSFENNNYVSVIGAPGDFVFPGEFTFEGWFFIVSINDGFMNLFTNNIDFPNSGFIQLTIRSVGDLFWNSSPGTLIGTFPSLVPIGQWTHLAITRDASNVVRLFIDGALLGSNSISGTIGGNNAGVSTFDIGRGIASDNGDLDGYFEEIRVTKQCRYTANFTPPSAPFPPFP